MQLRLALPTLVAVAALAAPTTALAVTSDLGVTIGSSENPAAEEDSFVWTLVVTNSGPDAALDVQVSFTGPAPIAHFVSANPEQGSAMTQPDSGMIWTVGTVASGTARTMTVQYLADHPGTAHSVATTTFNPAGGQSDPASGNNMATLDQVVTGLTLSDGTFGDQSLGTMGPVKSMTLTNKAGGTITVGTANLGGANPADFFPFLLGCDGATLAPSESCTLGARFAPSDLGARAGTLTVAPVSGAIDPATMVLSGNGVPLPVNTGPPGPAGPQGAKGDPAFKLVLAAALAKLQARLGRPVVVGYASTLSARVVLDVLKGKKRVARVRGRARTGANRIKWNARIRRKPAAAGRYTLRLTATSGDQTARATVRLRIVR